MSVIFQPTRRASACGWISRQLPHSQTTRTRKSPKQSSSFFPSCQELHTAEPRVSAALRCLHLRLRVVTFLAGHLEEPFALAGVLPLAGIVGTLAGRLSLAGIHTCAMNLGLIAREGAARENGAEQQGGGSCGGNAGGWAPWLETCKSYRVWRRSDDAVAGAWS